MKKSSKGFTLVELIVVIAIIGILAALLVPQLFKYIENAKIDTANDNAAAVYRTATTIAGDALAKGEPIDDANPYTKFNATKISAADNIAGANDATKNFRKDIQDSLEKTFESACWGVKIDSGKVVGAIYAKTASDGYVGGYPTLLKKDGSDVKIGGVKVTNITTTGLLNAAAS